MTFWHKGATTLALAALSATTLSACSQPDLPSCGTITQTSTTAVQPANVKFPLFTVHIELASGVSPVSIYDVTRKGDLGYPVGQTTLDTYMPAGTYVLHGVTQDSKKCQTAFEIK